MVFVKDHLLAIVIVPLLILMAGASYYRFMVLEDYYVIYETDCDPAEQSCYLGCENEYEDGCPEDEQYFYAMIERRAYELRELCGKDISECDDAYWCQPEVAVCEVQYCDAAEEECVSSNNL